MEIGRLLDTKFDPAKLIGPNNIELYEQQVIYLWLAVLLRLFGSYYMRYCISRHNKILTPGRLLIWTRHGTKQEEFSFQKVGYWLTPEAEYLHRETVVRWAYY